MKLLVPRWKYPAQQVPVISWLSAWKRLTQPTQCTRLEFVTLGFISLCMCLAIGISSGQTLLVGSLVYVTACPVPGVHLLYLPCLCAGAV